MSVLIWLLLFFCVRDKKCDGDTELTRICQHENFCISLSKGEITAEDGLCVVIPCRFTTNDEFKVTSVNWFKCKEDSQERCHDNSNPIFNSSNDQNIESGFRGRVSMLEPDLKQNNCSIIINNIIASDSGSYQLRVTGFKDEKTDGFTFTTRVKITVTGLSQKPIVMVPPLTAGQQNTLTCTAPGLCSGSVPQITWMWRKPGENNSYITGNITDTKTENMSDVTQRHSSTLTFNPSAGHNNTEVTCKVNFRLDKSTQETVTLNVSYTCSFLCKWPQVIIAIFFVMFLSAPIVCLSRKYYRLKHNNSENLSENIQMASTTVLQADDNDVEPTEVQYSEINFSKLKSRNHTKNKETKESPEAEYSEIKKGAKAEGQDEEGEAEMLEEDVVVMKEESESLYSNIKIRKV